MDKKVLTAEMDPVELRNVNIEPDDESSSGESAQDSYTSMENLEKAAMSRYKFKMNRFYGKIRKENKILVRKNWIYFLCKRQQ